MGWGGWGYPPGTRPFTALEREKNMCTEAKVAELSSWPLSCIDKLITNIGPSFFFFRTLPPERRGQLTEKDLGPLYHQHYFHSIRSSHRSVLYEH